METKLSADAKEFIPDLTTKHSEPKARSASQRDITSGLSPAVPEFVPRNKNVSFFGNSHFDVQYCWTPENYLSLLNYCEYGWAAPFDHFQNNLQEISPELTSREYKGQNWQKFPLKNSQQNAGRLATKSSRFGGNAKFGNQKQWYAPESKTNSSSSFSDVRSHPRKSYAKFRGPVKSEPSNRKYKDESQVEHLSVANGSEIQAKESSSLESKYSKADAYFKSWRKSSESWRNSSEPWRNNSESWRNNSESWRNSSDIQQEKHPFKSKKYGKQKYDDVKTLTKEEVKATLMSIKPDAYGEEMDERPRGKNSSAQKDKGQKTSVSSHQVELSSTSTSSWSDQNFTPYLPFQDSKLSEGNKIHDHAGASCWADSTMEPTSSTKKEEGTMGLTWSKIVQKGFSKPSQNNEKSVSKPQEDNRVGKHPKADKNVRPPSVESHNQMMPSNRALESPFSRFKEGGHHPTVQSPQERRICPAEDMKMKPPKPRSFDKRREKDDLRPLVLAGIGRGVNKRRDKSDAGPPVLAGIGRGVDNRNGNRDSGPPVLPGIGRDRIATSDVSKGGRYSESIVDRKDKSYSRENRPHSNVKSEDSNFNKGIHYKTKSAMLAQSHTETKATVNTVQASKSIKDSYDTGIQEVTESDDDNWEYVKKKTRKPIQASGADKVDEVDRQEPIKMKAETEKMATRNRLDIKQVNRDNQKEQKGRERFLKREGDRTYTNSKGSNDSEFRRMGTKVVSSCDTGSQKTDIRKSNQNAAPDSDGNKNKKRSRKKSKNKSSKPKSLDDEQQKIREYKMRQMIEDSLKDNLIQMKSAKKDDGEIDNEGINLEDEGDWPSIGLAPVASAPVISYSAALKRAVPPQQPRPPIKPRASTSDISECDLNDNTLTDEEKRKLMKEKRKQKRKDRKQRQKAEKEASGILPPPPQPKSKLTKAPITLDIGNLFDKLLKTSSLTPGRDQSRSTKAAVKRNILSTGVVSVVSGLAKKNTADGRKKEINKGKISSNPLDSNQPVRMRGKERETPKRKKPTLLKKVIMQERQRKQKERELKKKQDMLKETVNKNVKNSETLENEEKNEKKVTEDEESKNSLGKTGTAEEDNSGSTEELKKCKPLTNLPEAVIKELHCRKFREYCDHFLSQEIDDMVRQLLTDLHRFQERAVKDNPIKAKTKRRYVLGIREVVRHLKMKRLKCIIIAPNLERIAIQGGIDDYLGNILEWCKTVSTPTIFALTRQGLGRVLRKKVPISVIGIFNYDGAQDTYKGLLDEVSQSREKYREKVQQILSGNADEETPTKTVYGGKYRRYYSANKNKTNSNSTSKDGNKLSSNNRNDFAKRNIYKSELESQSDSSQRESHGKNFSNDWISSSSEAVVGHKPPPVDTLILQGQSKSRSEELLSKRNVNELDTVESSHHNKNQDSSDWETDNSDND